MLYSYTKRYKYNKYYLNCNHKMWHSKLYLRRDLLLGWLVVYISLFYPVKYGFDIRINIQRHNLVFSFSLDNNVDVKKLFLYKTIFIICIFKFDLVVQ